MILSGPIAADAPLGMFLFLTLALLAAGLGTIAGFGSATILTAVAAFFLDLKTAIVLIAWFHLAANLSRVTLFRSSLRWRLIVPFGIASALAVFAGALMVASVPLRSLQQIFGGFLILYVAARLTTPRVRLPQRLGITLLQGTASGFLSGLLGTGGAIRSAALMTMHLEKDIYLAASAAIACLNDLTRLPVYLATGIVEDPAAYALIPGLMLAAWAGTLLGRRVVLRISQRVFQRVVLTLLGLAGFKFLVFP